MKTFHKINYLVFIPYYLQPKFIAENRRPSGKHPNRKKALFSSQTAEKNAMERALIPFARAKYALDHSRRNASIGGIFAALRAG